MRRVMRSVSLLLAPPSPSLAKHYHWLDVVRGVAALTILFWHYQHFYFSGTNNPIVYDRDIQPFYGALSLFYDHGYFAVQLFWVISGFVFAAVYGHKPGSGREFFVNRFARLYPLHFATLIVVAGLQAISFWTFGEFQLYPHNDVYHFFLNLLFVPHWGFQEGDSFNAPIWSVSVELFVYIVFWLIVRRVFALGLLGPMVVAGSFVALFALRVPGPFWECGAYFFLGCATWVWSGAFGKRQVVNLITALAGIAAGASLLTSDIPHTGDAGRVLLFCGIVLLAASADALDRTRLGHKVGWLGDISYSLYLLHVPIQVTAILVMDALRLDRPAIAAHGWFLATYVAVVTASAVLCYRYFELPARHWIRRQLGSSQGKRMSAAPGLDRAAVATRAARDRA